MKNHRASVLPISVSVAVAAAVLGGCASKPPAELRDARAAYERATRTPGANLVQTDIYEAKKALARAEQRFDDEGDEAETRDVAYVAKAKAELARANAEAVTAQEVIRVAAVEKERLQAERRQQDKARMESHLEQKQQQLDTAQQKLDISQHTIAAERQARAAADQRANEALSKLSGLKAQQEERGLVLTLSGSLLFESGKSDLLPNAQTKLAEIAKVLKDDARQIRIVGHTDATGSDDTNAELSRRRAEAVRQFLSIRGVPDQRMTAEGAGSSQPVADNKTAAGRATNRRVEIVLASDAQTGSP